MIIPVSVKNQSIDSSGITSDYKVAINEYIWNGFEANATKVSIEYILNEAFGVKELIIKDNGDGINYNELGETFGAEYWQTVKRRLEKNARNFCTCILICSDVQGQCICTRQVFRFRSYPNGWGTQT